MLQPHKLQDLQYFLLDPIVAPLVETVFHAFEDPLRFLRQFLSQVLLFESVLELQLKALRNVRLYDQFVFLLDVDFFQSGRLEDILDVVLELVTNVLHIRAFVIISFLLFQFRFLLAHHLFFVGPIRRLLGFIVVLLPEVPQPIEFVATLGLVVFLHEFDVVIRKVILIIRRLAATLLLLPFVNWFLFADGLLFFVVVNDEAVVFVLISVFLLRLFAVVYLRLLGVFARRFGAGLTRHVYNL